MRGHHAIILLLGLAIMGAMTMKFTPLREAIGIVGESEQEAEKLLSDVKKMLPLSHYKYAMAALPLALEPIQKIRFIPYSLQRFRKFKEACSR